MTDIQNIGIQFEFSRRYINHFAQLFENISIDSYTWYVSCSENYSSCNGNVDFFLPDGVYSGYEFAQIIRSMSEYYVHLIRLFTVPNGNKFDPNKINNYEDYIKSAAEFALLSADSYVSFYAKNKNLLQTIFESCKRYYNNSTMVPKYITRQNDGRVSFWV